MSKKKYKLNIARLAVCLLIAVCLVHIAVHYIMDLSSGIRFSTTKPKSEAGESFDPMSIIKKVNKGDISEVSVSGPEGALDIGEYAYVYSYQGEEYSVTLTVRDTKAPVLTVKPEEKLSFSYRYDVDPAGIVDVEDYGDVTLTLDARGNDLTVEGSYEVEVTAKDESGNSSSITATIKIAPDEILNFSVICGGDVMAHGANIESAYKSDGTYFYSTRYQCYTTDGTFSFKDNYKYVKPYVEAADLALINVETTFSGGNEYSGYWGYFNAPDQLAEALKYAGFDVAFTCNNHSLDYGGKAGLRRTVKVLRDNELTVVGSRRETTEPRSAVVEANGVKVGIVAYTYETGAYGDGRSLNGAAMESGAPDYLNGFRPDSYGASAKVCDADKKAIAGEIKWCRENGAEVIICYFHWDMNNEYVLKVTTLQKDLARYVAEQGADIIFGSHPHRVQKMEVLTVSGGDGTERQVPVYYSLGNYVSNQRYETMDWTPADDPYASEQEIMAYLEIEYNRTLGTVTFTKISAIPLYVDKFVENTIEYRIYPLVGDYETGSELSKSGNAGRAKQAKKTITGIIGENYIYK